ncbi:chemotaxis protein CheB [Accumulibacter sp.]|uniref:chemotaxis protein CheB n=1 Tax=Accumulibacter sp. TaxID=2053492 RepID=UPI00263876F6|nr:chemotaxis protein CheB [Accumulibacter sp.]
MTDEQASAGQLAGPPPANASAASPECRRPEHLPIVGIGASAGGLEAYEAFFRQLPPDSGFAFVLVPHLDPDHASLLTEILQRSTAMPVVEAADQLTVAADTVYVIPPNREMAIRNGQLCVSIPASPRGLRMPIDAFLRSLADDQGDRAIGIVLSGTGTDGTLGLRAIHCVGGITLVQEPASAKFPGMPESAIGAGYATCVLPVADMASVLLAGVCQSVSHQRSPAIRAATGTTEATEAELDAVLKLLYAATGHDFSLYKKGTIGRRIARRMLRQQLCRVDDYLDYLGAHPDEAQALFKDLLINVSSFFRDPEAFALLGQQILPQLLADKPADYVLRIWVAGCASGEEAYSIAIQVREFMDQTQQAFKVQIYGTDLDEESIAVARAGFYPPNVAADLTPQRLQRFFLREDAGYRIKKEIREMLVFAVQDVIKDPPFTRLDLISCRNVMIYLEPEAQDRLVPSLHYALRPQGVLFLSPAESLDSYSKLFAPVNRKWRFYRAIGTAASTSAWMIGGLGLPGGHPGKPDDGLARKARQGSIADLTRRALLQSFAPASVVTDATGNIVFVHGDTGRFLRPAPGRATLNVVDMAVDGLQAELRRALGSASGQGVTTSGRQVPVRISGDLRTVRLSVRPLASPDTSQQLVLVSFQDVAASAASEPAAPALDKTSPALRRVEELERDLAQTWENLQTTIERQQVTNEELMSTNEELQSTNEELQSTIEELETSKEELQSINEELVTVNGELQANIEHLASTQSDLKNLLDNLSSGLIFLDRQLLVRRFTPASTDLYRLLASDIGRPLADINPCFDGPDLLGDARTVLATQQPAERELRCVDGHHYQARLKPYRTPDDDVDGVVITFTDISAHVASEARAHASQIFAEIVDTVREPLLVLDGDLVVVATSRSFYRRFQSSSQETIGCRLYDLGDRQWDIPALRALLGEVLPRDQIVNAFLVEADFPRVGHLQLLLNARRVAGETALILLAMEEVPSARTDPGV